MVVQGDVVWFHFGQPQDSSPAGKRPVLVVQHNRFNQSLINTVVVVAITSNLKRAAYPGNVRLRKGEAGLSKPSVVNMTQISTIDRSRVGAHIGRLTPSRMQQVWRGLQLVLEHVDPSGIY